MAKNIQGPGHFDEMIKNLEFLYGKTVKEFANFVDDRRIAYNTYNMMMEAAIEYNKQPKNIYMTCALHKAIHEDCKVIVNIIERFSSKNKGVIND